MLREKCLDFDTDTMNQKTRGKLEAHIKRKHSERDEDIISSNVSELLLTSPNSEIFGSNNSSNVP